MVSDQDKNEFIIGTSDLTTTSLSTVTMADTSAFANSGEEIISQSIDVEFVGPASPEEFADYYEIDRTVDEIVRGNYKRVNPLKLVRPLFTPHRSLCNFRMKCSKTRSQYSEH